MTPDRPLLSVIIPTHNRRDVIGRAIDSVLGQEYAPLEVIVVDDGSTDGTEEVVSQYLDRIRYVSQPNRERGAARNAGLTASTGELIAFLDSDDEMLPGHLGPLVEALITTPEVGIAYRQAEFFDDSTDAVFDVFPRRPVIGDAFLACAIGNRMTIGSVVVRRTLLDEVGWFDEDRELSGMEDWELWTRCLGTSEVTHVPGATVRIHFHAENTVGNPTAMERAIRSASEKILTHPRNRARLKGHRRRLEAARWSLIAHHHMLAGDARTARARLREGARKDPLIVVRPAWFSMATKAVVGTKVIGALRGLRRGLHLRRSTTSGVGSRTR